MNVTTKFFLFLLTSAVATPAMSAPFTTYNPNQDEGPKPVSIIIGLGTSHGGEPSDGGIITYPVSGGNFYTEDRVSLGGGISYFLGTVLALGDSNEIWMTYGQMTDEVKPGGSRVQVADPNYLESLKHDRIELMLFQKFGGFRTGLGAIMDRNIEFHHRDSSLDYRVKFDNVSGWGLGMGFDIPFNNDQAAVRLDARYIRMNYEISGFKFNANSIGYFLAVSF